MATAANPVVLAVDAHFYQSGLQVRRLADSGQPTFAAGPLADHVGFRDELPLTPGDRVVEITRLRATAGLITWIAVYQRSTDAVLGDRGNHAGVGVWLVNAAVIKPDLLLEGLRELGGMLTTDGVDRCAADAPRFLTDFVPAWIEPLRPTLPGLEGWPFSADPMPVTARYWAGAAAAEHAWALAAEHVHRMAVLPAATPAQARSLILLSAGATADATGLTPLRASLAAEIVRQLPDAVSAASTENATLRAEGKAQAAEVSRLAGELERTDQALDLAQGQLKEARQQLDESDPQRRFGRLDEQLQRLAKTQGETTGAVAELRGVVLGQRDLLSHRLDDLRRSAARSAPAATPSLDRAPSATRDQARPVTREGALAGLGLSPLSAAVLLLFVLLFGGVCWYAVHERSLASDQQDRIDELTRAQVERDRPRDPATPLYSN